jgi:hypothetical protein
MVHLVLQPHVEPKESFGGANQTLYAGEVVKNMKQKDLVVMH